MMRIFLLFVMVLWMWGCGRVSEVKLPEGEERLDYVYPYVEEEEEEEGE
jgi:uncharacterized protein YceK